ncbi:hypothetical protein LAZ67_8000687 [Cordylochernes scorpioides]|uniref:Uncharacterized protein n=1 Tax=Cordylochernes scorpioides TaxID=51811 RepID=A0ABY6KPP2_9ARAC|nr:hypothetical protein LAZ67_8000687 [Cordylochernes scorpioides]
MATGRLKSSMLGNYKIPIKRRKHKVGWCEREGAIKKEELENSSREATDNGHGRPKTTHTVIKTTAFGYLQKYSHRYVDEFDIFSNIIVTSD